MIAGLETVTAGEVAIGGRPVNDREPAERDIAMVFQNYLLKRNNNNSSSQCITEMRKNIEKMS
jgi:ABC-type sugar transport system ATPase subunit